jgi:hypothetical protein
MEKKVYVPPKLTTYGDVETITHGFQTGDSLDATFVVGTPKGAITFS